MLVAKSRRNRVATLIFALKERWVSNNGEVKAIMSYASGTLILCSVMLSAIAQIAFKWGVSSEAGPIMRALLGSYAALATPGVITGLALYGVGTLLWIQALKRIDVSQAYPFVSLGF